MSHMPFYVLHSEQMRAEMLTELARVSIISFCCIVVRMSYILHQMSSRLQCRRRCDENNWFPEGETAELLEYKDTKPIGYEIWVRLRM
jgi:hypothetical protein